MLAAEIRLAKDCAPILDLFRRKGTITWRVRWSPSAAGHELRSRSNLLCAGEASPCVDWAEKAVPASRQAIPTQKRLIDQEPKVIRLQWHSSRSLSIEECHQLDRGCSSRFQI